MKLKNNFVRRALSKGRCNFRQSITRPYWVITAPQLLAIL